MDINIKLIIADTEVNDLKLGLAKGLGIDTTEINVSWFKKFLQDMLMKYYMTGKIKIARETTPPDINETIIQVE